jgi:hypothetical protein
MLTRGDQAPKEKGIRERVKSERALIDSTRRDQEKRLWLWKEQEGYPRWMISDYRKLSIAAK